MAVIKASPSQGTSDALLNIAANAIVSYDAQSSPLLSLPGEVRNQIYTYVFASSAYYIRGRRGPNGKQRSGIEFAYHSLAHDHPRLPLLLTCRQIYCETVDISLSLSTFMFSMLSILSRCNYLPAHIRSKIQHVRLLTSVTVTAGAIRFMDQMRYRGLGLIDLLPNAKSIDYDVQASHVAADERMRSFRPGPSWTEVVEQWFQKAGDVELRRHDV